MLELSGLLPEGLEILLLLDLPISTYREDENAPLHTDAHPFCGDKTCPCYWDGELLRKYVQEFWFTGLLSSAEAERIYRGQHPLRPINWSNLMRIQEETQEAT